MSSAPIGIGVRDAPHGWRYRLLTDVARLESGHTPSRRHPEWWNGDISWLALADIRKLDGKTAQATIETINEFGIANSSARILPINTVCMSRTASVGYVAVLGTPMATSQDFVNWVCGLDLNPWFLAYALIASRDYLRELSSGAIHKTIYMPTVKSFGLNLPTLPEQNRIVEVVEGLTAEATAAARAAEAQRATLATAARAAAGVLLDAMIANHQMQPLASFADARDAFRDGPFGSNLKTVHYRETGARVIRLQNLGDGFFVDAHKAYVSLDHFKTIEGHSARTDDVIVAALGDGARPAGRAVVLPDLGGPAVVKADCFRIRLSPTKVRPAFLALFINSAHARNQLAGQLRGATRPRVNLEMLRALPMPSATLEEQDTLLAHIETVTKAANDGLAALARQAAAIAALPPSILSAAFRGDL